jgi:cobalt-zinc-cadmium resistance protein CzcA
VAVAAWLASSGIIGSEFLPHLDEGAIWARGTLAPSTGPDEGNRVDDPGAHHSGLLSGSHAVVSQVGRPDDGTDTTGFFQYRILRRSEAQGAMAAGIPPKKVELIAAMDRELEKIPGVLWNFSQPIADNMEEAVSGVKGELAIKIYGTDLKKLEETGDQIVNVMRNIRGIEDLGLFRVIGQPNLNFTVDRDQAARYGINVSDVQDAIQTAVGGNAVSQVLAG